MRVVLRTMVMGALVALAGCHTPNADAIEENAVVSEDDTRDAADQRAANLDRLADSIDNRAQASGNATGALRNEAAQDRLAADAVRAEGRAQADAIETNVESRVGVNVH